jgi:dihydrofolate reductase
MQKLIAAINMTLDGVCDHTALVADDEIHLHYSELLSNADSIIYGRITYQLMEYWKTVLENPTGNKATDKFAQIIDKIPKIVFSRTLKNVDWETAKLADGDIKQVVLELKQQVGKDILVGSPSLIVTLMNLNLIDELQLCVQPIIAGKGMRLLENIDDRIELKLLKTKMFTSSGSIILYYQPTKNDR